MKRVFITGVGGFVGSALAQHLAALGVSVCGSTHHRPPTRAAADYLDSLDVIELGTAPPPELFRDCDAIVHAAYIAGAKTWAENVEGTRLIFEAARAQGVDHQIFISSHSARADVTSEYGLQKYAIEQLFLEHGHSVIRPGLVIGNGGLFKANYRVFAKTPILFAPSPRTVPVFYIWIDDLLTSIACVIHQKLPGSHNIFQSRPATLDEFFDFLSKLSANKPFVIPFPAGMAFAALRVAKALGCASAPAIARIDAMRLNVCSPIHVSDVERFVASPAMLQDILDHFSTVRDDL